MNYTESATKIVQILRDGGQFQWYLIALFALIVYVYAVEIERRNWSLVFAGLAFWGMDWFNEIWNSIVFHATSRAPVWGAPGKTGFLIFSGLNIEICFMFAIAGIVFGKMLPPDRRLKVLRIPNRAFIAVTGSIFCVVIEILLNRVGALTWDWSFWNAGAPWLIFLVGYLPFFVVSFWVHDMPTVKKKVMTVGVIYGIDALGILIFGIILRWI